MLCCAKGRFGYKKWRHWILKRHLYSFEDISDFSYYIVDIMLSLCICSRYLPVVTFISRDFVVVMPFTAREFCVSQKDTLLRSFEMWDFSSVDTQTRPQVTYCLLIVGSLITSFTIFLYLQHHAWHSGTPADVAAPHSIIV